MTMTRILGTALVAGTVMIGAAALTGAHAAPASPYAYDYSPSWTDMSQPYGGFAPNSQAGNRAFWEYQQRYGNTSSD